jgi:hypothetical protein
MSRRKLRRAIHFSRTIIPDQGGNYIGTEITPIISDIVIGLVVSKFLF